MPTAPPTDIVTLTRPAVSRGDKTRPYPAGTRFLFRRVVRALPDLGEVRAALDYGDRAKPREPTLTPVPVAVEVLALTPDRSRLLFDPADVAATGGT